MDGPFHEGERFVQRLAGELEEADMNGSMIGSLVPNGAVRFLEALPMVVLASSDREGATWASLVFGEPGFLRTETRAELLVDLDRALVDVEDPFWKSALEHPAVGALAIDLATRKRLRVNGDATVGPKELRIDVREAYPNCPKYIQRRRPAEPTFRPPRSPRQGNAVDEELAHLIGGCDTLFVASHHAERGADVSHRGGSSGFVRVLNEHTLRVPDYAGNGMFNTLGNLALDPRAGVTFVDFAQGLCLQASGRAQLIWDADEVETRRAWDFTLDCYRLTSLPNGLAWSEPEPSPYNPG